MNSSKLAQKSRIDAVKMVHAAKASHIGSALSIIDILWFSFKIILYSIDLDFIVSGSGLALLLISKK